MTAEQLKKEGIEDFQMNYALQTLERIGTPQLAGKSGPAKAGRD
jgi:carboxyl-terminal processing protease